MKFISLASAVAVGALAFPCGAAAEGGDLTLSGLMATAKFSGACGAMNALVQFQSSTKLDGGDELVSRFWNVEAARLGMSLQQLAEQCASAIAAYDRVLEAAETEGK